MAEYAMQHSWNKDEDDKDQIADNDDQKKEDSRSNIDKELLFEQSYSSERWLTLCVLTLLTANTSLQLMFCSASARSIERYYNISVHKVQYLTCTSVLLTGLVLTIPCIWVVYETSLRTGCLVNACLTTIAALLKYSGFSSSTTAGYIATLSGQTCSAIAMCFIIAMPVELATVWFKANQRATATCMILSGHVIGASLGMALATSYLADILDTTVIECALKTTQIIQATLSLLTLLVVYLLFQNSPLHELHNKSQTVIFHYTSKSIDNSSQEAASNSLRQLPHNNSQAMLHVCKCIENSPHPPTSTSTQTLLEEAASRSHIMLQSSKSIRNSPHQSYRKSKISPLQQVSSKSMENSFQEAANNFHIMLHTSKEAVSRSQAKFDHYKPSFVQSLSTLLHNHQFCLLAVTFGLALGAIYAFSQIIQEYLRQHFVGQEHDAGMLGAASTILPVPVIVLTGIWLDKTITYASSINLAACISVLASAVFTILRFSHSLTTIYCALAIFRFFSIPFVTMTLLVASEVTQPVPEILSSGILYTSAQIFAILLTNIVLLIYWKLGNVVMPCVLGTSAVLVAAVCISIAQPALKQHAQDKLDNIA